MTRIRIEKLADNVTLYCGDCREVLPTLGKLVGVDVVSDAPYGIEDLVGKYGRTGSSNDSHIANDKNLDVVGEAFALLRKQMRSGWLAAFYSCRISPTFFKMLEKAGWRDSEYFGDVVWDKKVMGLGTQIRYQHENVAFYRIGKPAQLTDAPSVLTFMPVKGDAKTNSHPHEKPEKVMQNIVGMVPGKMILDCFMGSGSTGAAAVQLKRGFVGIELDAKYFEVACRKIGAAIKQPVAFWE